MVSILVLLGVAVVVWLGHSYLYPWTSCPLCKGNPRNSSKGSFNVWCKACRSSGRRRRLGARLLGRGFGQW